MGDGCTSMSLAGQKPCPLSSSEMPTFISVVSHGLLYISFMKGLFVLVSNLIVAFLIDGIIGDNVLYVTSILFL